MNRSNFSFETITFLLMNIKSKLLKSKLKEIQDSLLRLINAKSELYCESIRLTLNKMKKTFEHIMSIHLKTYETLNKIQNFLKLTRITIVKADNEINNISNLNCQKLFIMLKVLCEKYQFKVYLSTEDSFNIFASRELVETLTINNSNEEIKFHC